MKNTKENILQSALGLFLLKGFKEVTLKEIADKTDLSKGAFYHHFSSKEQVFAEVINHFFTGMMTTDYSQLPQGSLRGFYNAILNKIEPNAFAGQNEPHNPAAGNYYHLLFDAMRILPDFKQQRLNQQHVELIAWRTVVADARNNYEIRSNLTNEQVAKTFIYLNDGINLNLAINSGADHKSQLKEQWDGIYNTLKTQNI